MGGAFFRLVRTFSRARTPTRLASLATLPALASLAGEGWSERPRHGLTATPCIPPVAYLTEAHRSPDNLGAPAMDTLKLVALDRDDVEIISTHLQDSVLKVADIRWRPSENRLVLAVNRFDWEAAHENNPEYRRRRSVLRFDRVRNCKCRNVDPKDAEAVLNLLAVEFAETDMPAGVVTLVFSGGAAMRLEVECLEVELADLGPVWTTATCPIHQHEAT